MVSSKYRDLSSGPAKICRRGFAPAWDYSQPTANDKQGDPADRKKTVFGLFDMKTQYNMTHR